MDDFSDLWFDCEDSDTPTAVEQCMCEKECSKFLTPYAKKKQEFLDSGLLNSYNEIRLLRRMHGMYLKNGLLNLSAGFVSLDSSRPWICYWIMHALYLLDETPSIPTSRIVATLAKMQTSNGGFGGGPQQLPHAAPNYAAVLTLCTIGTEEAFSTIHRANMYKFFLSIKHSSGGFRMHYDGEVDSRGTYTVLAIARILNILTPQLVEGAAEYIQSCQSYEGGFGGEPGNEAHGGYNFCALAALLILGKTHLCNIDAQEHWLLSRQMKLEGGFQGRTNKLVDSCYSFWQGAALAIIKIIRVGGNDVYDMNLYMSQKLQAQQQAQAQPSTATSDTTASITTESSSSSSAHHGETEHNDSDKLRYDDNDIVDIDIDITDENTNNNNNNSNNINTLTTRIASVTDNNGELQFNQKALQKYILHCGQNNNGGGLRDKPGKSRDYYHSCYALSGLSIAQWSNITPAPVTHAESESVAVTEATVEVGNREVSNDAVSNGTGNNSAKSAVSYSSSSSSSSSTSNSNSNTNKNNTTTNQQQSSSSSSSIPSSYFPSPKVYGDSANLVKPTSAVFNIGLENLFQAITYFQQQPSKS